MLRNSNTLNQFHPVQDGLPRYCVHVLCSFFRECMCPCTCLCTYIPLKFQQFLWNWLTVTLFLSFLSLKNEQGFSLICFTLQIFLYLDHEFILFFVGDPVNWPQGQLLPLFMPITFCFPAVLSWHLLWWTIVLPTLWRTFGVVLQVISAFFIGKRNYISRHMENSSNLCNQHNIY